MATTPKSGKAHDGIMPDVFSGVAACCTSVASLASYLRAVGGAVAQGLAGTGTGAGAGTGTTGAQGLAGVGAGVVGGGVVVTVVGMKVQHVALLHPPDAQIVLSEFLENPSPQVKPAQVGGGVVVTVVMMTVQHVAESHLPI